MGILWQLGMKLRLGHAQRAMGRSRWQQARVKYRRAWEILAQVCPDRTSGLVALAEDPDPAVADGAARALVEVKRLCTDWSVFSGP